MTLEIPAPRNYTNIVSPRMRQAISLQMNEIYLNQRK